MKTNGLFLWAVLGLLFLQCSRENSVSPAKIDYDQASIQLMKDLAPQIVGNWTLRRVQIKYQNYNSNQRQLGIVKDTAFYNLATLSIIPAIVPRSSPRDLRRGEYDGTIQYGGKTYPIQLNLLANPDWIVNKEGPQAFFLFEYHFPVGSHWTEPEEAFLENIGLVNDNFSLEIATGKPAMTWRGLNRGVQQIDLVKQ